MKVCKPTHFTYAIVLALLAANAAHTQGARQNAEVIVPSDWQHTYEGMGFAPAIKVAGTIYVSGVISVLEGEGPYEERYARGFVTAMQTIGHILEEAGATMDDIVELTTFHTDLHRQLQPAINARKELMNAPHPAWTAVGTTALAMPEGMTEIKVIAYTGT